MIRIAGVTLPNKQILYALTAIYGVGLSTSKKIVRSCGINPLTKTQDVTAEEEQKIRNLIEGGDLKIEGELRREIQSHIRRLKEIGSFRGSRHAKRLPVRGGRTKTNSRTVRGNVRKTMGSGRKPTAQKT